MVSIISVQQSSDVYTDNIMGNVYHFIYFDFGEFRDLNKYYLAINTLNESKNSITWN